MVDGGTLPQTPRSQFYKSRAGLPGRPHPDDDPFARPADRARLLMMRPFFPGELADRHRYFAWLWGHVAAGYISGSRASMLRVRERFDQAARAALADGYAPSDEQLLPIVAASEPGLFEYHHGDYGHILANYVRPRGSAENLAFQLRILRDAGVFARADPLCRPTVESIEAGGFEAGSQALAGLLDECFLAAYYGEDEPRELARRILELYRERVERDPAFRDTFLRDEIRLRRNFAFLGGDG